MSQISNSPILSFPMMKGKDSPLTSPLHARSCYDLSAGTLTSLGTAGVPFMIAIRQLLLVEHTFRWQLAWIGLGYKPACSIHWNKYMCKASLRKLLQNPTDILMCKVLLSFASANFPKDPKGSAQLSSYFSAGQVYPRVSYTNGIMYLISFLLEKTKH